MKEVGRPDAVRQNEEAVQMHHFSEKMRFDKASFKNAEKPRGHAADPGDTGADRAIGEASSQTAEGQTHGVMHQSPETLPHAREPVGEKPEHEALHMGDMPVEEAAGKGYTVLPGSKNAMAPNLPEGRRSFFSAAGVGQRDTEGQNKEQGIAPGVEYSQQAPEVEFDPARTPKPDTPDEEAPAIERAAWEEEAGSEAHVRSGVAGTALEWEGIAPGKAPMQKGGLHTWAAARFATGRRGLHTARFVTRAYPQGQEGGEPGEVASSPAAQREELAGLKAAGGSSPTEAPVGQSSGAARPSSPGPCCAEEQHLQAGADPDDVMEERIEHPDIGGYAS
ncbi:hypothetical protein ABPG77_008930 [Micractinium sp. CCAP 211/92]